jgi:hypothetical protein
MSTVVESLPRSRPPARARVVLTVAAVAAVVLPVSFLLPLPPGPKPPPPVLLAVAGVFLAEALAFGGAVAWLWRARAARLPVRLTLIIAWLLGNWWPHDHLHLAATHLGPDRWVYATYAIEYVFHLTIIAGAGYLAWRFIPAQRRRSAALLTLAISVIALPVNLAVFPFQAPLGVPLTGLPAVLGAGELVAECLALGAGVATIAFGLRGAGSPMAALARIGVAWFLVNWYVHDHLHTLAANDVAAQMRLEYGFHVTMIAFAAILAIHLGRRAVSEAR